MIVRIDRPAPGGKIKAIASKSQAHRLLICAALSEVETFVGCAESSDDITATAACLTALGAEILREHTGYRVKPVPKPFSDGKKILDCGESGTTYRFMLPVCCAFGASVEFMLGGRLPSRPTGPLLNELARHGCTITGAGGSPVCAAGQMQSGIFTLPGDVSSQFISGLLLALPMLRGDSTVVVEGSEESKPYIDMTLDALRIFGIKTGREDGRYSIKGRQSFRSPGMVTVEGDWSNAAFWLCAGALSKTGVTCTGLNLASAQGDMEIVGLLERFGAEVTRGDGCVTVSGGKRLCGIRIDAGDTPDLVPVLAVVASAAEGETVIYNAERLRIKESDRLKTVTQTLKTLGADIEEKHDGLVIKGRETLTGGTVSSHGDHRIAMAAAVASAVCKGAVTIKDAEAVRKSYPGFFEDLCMLGGAISEGD